MPRNRPRPRPTLTNSIVVPTWEKLSQPERGPPQKLKLTRVRTRFSSCGTVTLACPMCYAQRPRGGRGGGQTPGAPHGRAPGGRAYPGSATALVPPVRGTPRVAPPYGHARGRATPRGAQHRVSPGPGPRAHPGPTPAARTPGWGRPRAHPGPKKKTTADGGSPR